MSEARRKRRANRTEDKPQHRSVSGASPVYSQSSSSVSPLPIGKSALSGRALWVCLALIAANVIVYAQVRHYTFVSFDDPQIVSDNPHISGGLTWQGMRWAITAGYYGDWHPLTWLSHMIDVQLYGLNAGPHHLTNVLLHIASTLLLFGLLHRMTGALGRSAFVAGLFAVHPLHVESVAWLSARTDVLSTLFWMLTLWGYIWYASKPRLGRYLVVLLLFALGLMSKPMLVTLPFVLLLLDFWPLGRVGLEGASPGWSGLAALGDRRSIVLRLAREKLPMFAFAVASSIITFMVRQQGMAVVGLEKLPLYLRITNALVSYVAYIGKMLWPVRLAVFYPYPRFLPDWWVVGSILSLIGVSVVAIRAARRHPYLPVGWLWYLGTLVPVIGLVQVGEQAMADRYTYVPLIGLFIIMAWGIPDLLVRWPYRSIALPTAAGLVLSACTITARVQVQYWENSIALWEHAVEVTTENDRAQLHLGVALSDQGRSSEAIAHYIEALRIRPEFPQAHNDLGVAFAEQGKVDEAIAHYSEALRLKPDFPDAHNNLGAALAEQGKVDEAIHEFMEALRINPDQAEWHFNVAVMYDRKGNSKEAVNHLETALKLNPRHQEARRMLDELTSPGKRSVP